jgi:hypothetical protein
MRFAYADPPYIGQAKKHYGHLGGSEVDHVQLIAQLESYDGWALSLSTPTLQHILAICPTDVRIAAWVKPFCSWKPGVNPAYTWEPVIWKSSRKRTREQVTVRDYVATSITLQRGLTGAKPEAFCYWLFELLNIQPGDTFDDLFPGTRAVTRAFEQWSHNRLMWNDCEVPA